MKIIVTTILLFVSALCFATTNKDIESTLQALDVAVDNAPTYIANKEAEIHRIKNNLRLAVADVDKYLSCKQIAEAYSHYKSDSALVYYRRCFNYGKANNNIMWMQDAAIHQALILADRGDNHMATDRLRMLGTINDICPQLRNLYADAAMMEFVRVSNDEYNQFSTSRAVKSWRIYSSYISHRSNYYYIYYTVVHPDHNPVSTAKSIQNELLSTPKGTAHEAILRMMLGVCYKKSGDIDRAIIEFAHSTIIDIKNTYTNSSSLTMLLAELNNDKNVNVARLLKYTKLNIDNINMYNDIGRSIHLVNAQKPILLRYQEAMQQRLQSQMIIGMLTIVLLIVSIFFAWSLHKKSKTIALQRDMLKVDVQDLQHDMLNTQENVANKDETIAMLKYERVKTGRLLAQHLSYLSQALNDIKAYKKEVANMIASGRTAEARKMTKENVTKDRTQALFCEIFDHSFLDIHPDFPMRLNQLLTNDEQLSSGYSHVLTPEQRIYALISLGIDDSKNIAEILHYSIQTVYNYRMKMRHMAVSENEKLDDAVKQFYT